MKGKKMFEEDETYAELNQTQMSGDLDTIISKLQGIQKGLAAENLKGRVQHDFDQYEDEWKFCIYPVTPKQQLKSLMYWYEQEIGRRGISKFLASYDVADVHELTDESTILGMIKTIREDMKK
jgi:hypothetical protein